MKKLLMGVGVALALVLMSGSIEAKNYSGNFSRTHLWDNYYIIYCSGGLGDCGSTYTRIDGRTVFTVASTGDQYLLTNSVGSTPEDDFSGQGELTTSSTTEPTSSND